MHNEEATCWHESAHACAFQAFRFPIDQVAITSGTEGHCDIVAGSKKFFSVEEIRSLKERQVQLEKIIALCAGSCGEVAFSGNQSERGWIHGDDAETALRLCLTLSDGDQVAAKHLLGYAMRKAELLVERERPRITKLAFALLEHRRLDGSKVAEILNNGAA